MFDSRDSREILSSKFTCKKLLHPNAVIDMAISGDENTLVTVGTTTKIWDLKTGKCLKTIPGCHSSVSFTEEVYQFSKPHSKPLGRIILGGSKGCITTLNSDTYLLKIQPEKKCGSESVITIASSGSLVAAVNNDECIKIWRSTTCIFNMPPHIHKNYSKHTAIAKNLTILGHSYDTTIVVVGKHGKFEILDCSSIPRLIMTLSIPIFPNIRCLASSGKIMVVTTKNGVVIWDITTDASIFNIKKNNMSDTVYSAGIFKDRKFIALGYGNGSVGIWDLTTKQRINNLNSKDPYNLVTKIRCFEHSIVVARELLSKGNDCGSIEIWTPNL